MKDETLHTCNNCGCEYTWHYISEHKGNCFDCQFWIDRLAYHEANPDHSIVVEGTFYMIGDENAPGRSQFRGFGGRPFYIRRKDGTLLRSTNVWCQGSPIRSEFIIPDTAEFLTRGQFEAMLEEEE